MRHWAVACALLLPLLSGCGAIWPDTSTPDGQCEAAAYDDPVVKDILVRKNTGSTIGQLELLPQERDAVERAKLRCLQQRGLAPRGGVEQVRRGG